MLKSTCQVRSLNSRGPGFNLTKNNFLRNLLYAGIEAFLLAVASQVSILNQSESSNFSVACQSFKDFSFSMYSTLEFEHYGCDHFHPIRILELQQRLKIILLDRVQASTSISFPSALPEKNSFRSLTCKGLRHSETNTTILAKKQFLWHLLLPWLVTFQLG